MCNNIVDRISSLDLGHDEYLLIFALAFLASGKLSFIALIFPK
jgi:hypothetical protein